MQCLPLSTTCSSSSHQDAQDVHAANTITSEFLRLSIAPATRPNTNYYMQQLLRQAARPAASSLASRASRPAASAFLRSPMLSLAQQRLLSDATRQAIDKAVASAPVVLFMKGTPETPQCGFSRASIQILGLQGVDPNKFAAFNVLEDSELRAGG